MQTKNMALSDCWRVSFGYFVGKWKSSKEFKAKGFTRCMEMPNFMNWQTINHEWKTTKLNFPIFFCMHFYSKFYIKLSTWTIIPIHWTLTIHLNVSHLKIVFWPKTHIEKIRILPTKILWKTKNERGKKRTKIPKNLEENSEHFSTQNDDLIKICWAKENRKELFSFVKSRVSSQCFKYFSQ